MAAEITREKLFLRMNQELPYSLTVETESWEEKKDGSVKINQVIYVSRENHKPMILGKGGQTIKKIGAVTVPRPVFDRDTTACPFVFSRPSATSRLGPVRR